MTTANLHQLYAEHTGKVSFKWLSYLARYERFFATLRDKPIRLLEIGVQNGGSLEIWAKYFRQASILIGCDIDPACMNLVYDDPRIKIVVGDANAPMTREKIFNLCPGFDIIVDDGSHYSGDIVKSFMLYFPCLASDGIYVVEDMHASYWNNFEGGLFYPYSSISFFKRLVDVLNHEHWGIAKARADILRGTFDKHGYDFAACAEAAEDLLAQIHSLEFSNSMCAVHKSPAADNRLGPAVINGLSAAVNAMPLQQKKKVSRHRCLQASNRPIHGQRDRCLLTKRCFTFTRRLPGVTSRYSISARS